MSTDFRICLFCSDDKLSVSVSEGLAGIGAPDALRAKDFGALLDAAEAGDGPVVVLLSLADLCAEGLDAINLVDMQLSLLPRVTSVLLAEPWVRSELESVMLMTGFGLSVPSGELESLGSLLEQIIPGLKLRAPRASAEFTAATGPAQGAPENGSGQGAAPPPPSSHAVRDVSQTRSVVRDIHGLSDGRLDDIWLPRILYSLYVRKFTGDLTLGTPQRELSIKLVDGLAGDHDTGDRSRVLSAFAWTSGTFSISPGPPSKTTFRTYGSTLELIYDGCLEFVSINQTAQRLSGYDDYFPVCTDFFETRGQLLERRDVLRKFCLSCDGTRSWSQIISATWHDVREVLKAAIYALETDLIVMRPKRSAERASVRYTTRSTAGIRPAEVSASRSTVNPEEEAKIVERLRTRLEHFDRMDAYSLFGLRPGCGLKTVRAHFYKMVKQHHPDVYGGNLSPDIQGMAELVFIHIKDAYVELVNLERDTVEVEDERPSSPSERVVSKIRSKDATSRTAQKAREAHGVAAAPSSRPSRPSRSIAEASPSRPVRSAAETSRSRPVRPTAQAPSRPSRPSAEDASRSGRLPPEESGAHSRPTQTPQAPTPVTADPVSPDNIRKTRQRSIPAAVTPEKATVEGTPAVVFEPPAGPSRRARPLRGKSGRSGQTISAPSVRAPRATDEPAVARPTRATDDERDRMSSRLPPAKHFKNGTRFLQAKAYDKAKKAFRHAVSGEEDNPLYRAHYAYARYLENPEDFTKCLQMLQGCLELDGRMVEVHLFMGRIAKQEGQSNRAIKSFRAALAEDRRNIEASRELRLHQMRGGKPEETEETKGAGGKSDGTFFSKLFQRKKDS